MSNRKYEPALRRSAWLPHLVMIIRLGMRVVSNRIENMMRSVAINVRIRVIWRKIIMER